jgi:Tol biopolymer transport system component
MAVTLAEVTKLYVATFNRAPDAAGINYWANSGMSIENIAQSFFDQSETQTLYPSGTANSSFVTSVYDNLFNRTPDTAGFDYWVQELDKGLVSKQNFILAVINGALDEDATILTNKQTVGLDFVSKGLDDVTLARNVMANVDATQTSVDSALDLIDSGSNTPVISDIQMISTSSSGVQGNISTSQAPSISADGRYIVFESSAYNLVDRDTNYKSDIFLKDTLTGATTLVSTSSSGTQGNNHSSNPYISADGKHVVFESEASNLVDGDTNGYGDIFIKDIQTGVITLVSTSSSGVQGIFDSSNPSISADGKYVVFDSFSSNLVDGDTNDTLDIFLKDIQEGTLTLVSTSSSGIQGTRYYSSQNPSISADGRYVAFESQAANLVSGDTGVWQDIFLKDIQTGETTLVSASSSGSQEWHDSYNPSISADGRYVIFERYTSGYKRDIFLKDTQTGALTMVSTSSSGEVGNDASNNPSISADGRYVTFGSAASNLVSGDTNGYGDIFLKDTQTGTTILVASASSSGDLGNGYSSPSISGDGSNIAFVSGALVYDGGGELSAHWEYEIFLVGINGLF